MNGPASPKSPQKRDGDAEAPLDHVTGGANGTRSPEAAGTTLRSPSSKPETGPSTASANENGKATQNGGDDVESEAETLIESPVKKREAERQKAAVQADKPARSRIGGLPVPGEDDDESSSVVTPIQTTEAQESKPAERAKDEHFVQLEVDSEKADSSGSLSSAPSPTSTADMSLVSAQSRAMSEGPEASRNGADSPNPRKRKHRASSVGFPNKRQSMDPPKRALRGMHSEDTRQDRSPSPRLRNHRRAVSTQSALLDGASDGSNRKRRSGAQFPVRDPKSSKWEESDASSETTSYGNVELRRPQRGVGRSTSIPGRPPGREHKRHINRYGMTRLAEACESNNLQQVKQWREKDPDQLEIADNAQNKPLQIAAIRGFAEIVEYLIDQGCQIDCANVDKDTPLIDAAENGYLEVVQILLRAGVDPLRQNLRGQQALDVIPDDEDHKDEIRAALREAIDKWNSDGAKQRREEEEETRHRAGPSKELHFMARTYENLQKLVANNDRTGVREFLDARVPVDNNIIAIAAKTGDQYLVNMLLAEMNDKKAHQKPEKPMLAVLGTSHFEMVKMLTELDQFNPLWRNRSGKNWVEIAEERSGPNWRQEHELLQRLYDQAARTTSRRSSSPVTKREGAKRRPPPRYDEDSDENDSGDEEQKPKNGRRLMSRRAMRAANGKAALSDSESEDASNSEQDAPGEPEPEPETKMKPPDTPTQHRRGSISTRTRTKSLSAQPQPVTELPSPRSRRRSSSLRGLQDNVLPTVEEQPEASEAAREEPEEMDVDEAVQREDQARIAKQEEEEAAAAEAKRIEDEAKKAEDMRKAEEARVAAEAARVKEEEERARQAEEARKAEEELQRREAELDSARSEYRLKVLSLLPESVREALQSDNIPSAYDLLPLQAIDEDDQGYTWILNVQAAPHLGRGGLELLLPRSSELDFQRTFSGDWPIRDNLSDPEHNQIKLVLRQMVHRDLPTADVPPDVQLIDDSFLPFELEVQRQKDRREAIGRAVDRLNTDNFVSLELVRLQDFLARLQLEQQQRDVTVHYRKSRKRKLDEINGLPARSFLAKYHARLTHAPATRMFRGVEEVTPRPAVHTAKVIVVDAHQAEVERKEKLRLEEEERRKPQVL